ncbi:MAG: hypothetical protein HY770_02595 [Chitinivibrionia bacterium]|nr:hypothetical protein [Chitinivibrionia bacterium]
MIERKTYAFNWKVFVSGMMSIILGYILLIMSDITIAPILLVLGYCVLIPVSFL